MALEYMAGVRNGYRECKNRVRGRGPGEAKKQPREMASTAWVQLIQLGQPPVESFLGVLAAVF